MAVNFEFRKPFSRNNSDDDVTILDSEIQPQSAGGLKMVINPCPKIDSPEKQSPFPYPNKVAGHNEELAMEAKNSNEDGDTLKLSSEIDAQFTIPGTSVTLPDAAATAILTNISISLDKSSLTQHQLLILEPIDQEESTLLRLMGIHFKKINFNINCLNEKGKQSTLDVKQNEKKLEKLNKEIDLLRKILGVDPDIDLLMRIMRRNEETNEDKIIFTPVQEEYWARYCQYKEVLTRLKDESDWKSQEIDSLQNRIFEELGNFEKDLDESEDFDKMSETESDILGENTSEKRVDKSPIEKTSFVPKTVLVLPQAATKISKIEVALENVKSTANRPEKETQKVPKTVEKNSKKVETKTNAVKKPSILPQRSPVIKINTQRHQKATPVVASAEKPKLYGPLDFVWKNRNHPALVELFLSKSEIAKGQSSGSVTNYGWVNEQDMIFDAFEEFMDNFKPEMSNWKFGDLLSRHMYQFLSRFYISWSAYYDKHFATKLTMKLCKLAATAGGGSIKVRSNECFSQNQIKSAQKVADEAFKRILLIADPPEPKAKRHKTDDEDSKGRK